MNRSARETSHDLSCPNCVATMRHVATLAKFAVHPELRIDYVSTYRLIDG